MLLVFFTLTVFVLVLMLEVQKGYNGVVDSNYPYLDNLQTKGVRITEDALWLAVLTQPLWT